MRLCMTKQLAAYLGVSLYTLKKIRDAGGNIVEVPVHHHNHLYGRSQFFNFRRIFRVGVRLIRLWWKLVVSKEHLFQPQ